MLGRNKRVAALRENFQPITEEEADTFFKATLAEWGIERLPGEIPFTVLQVWDWKRQRAGVPMDLCECRLIPTTCRLLVAHPAQHTMEDVLYEDIRDLTSKLLAYQGFIRFTIDGQKCEFTTKRLAAPAFVAFVQELRSKSS
jgi:hypothetical protein